MSWFWVSWFVCGLWSVYTIATDPAFIPTGEEEERNNAIYEQEPDKVVVRGLIFTTCLILLGYLSVLYVFVQKHFHDQETKEDE